jgi:energy-coupling factor transporter transmembrane protein EcfT
MHETENKVPSPLELNLMHTYLHVSPIYLTYLFASSLLQIQTIAMASTSRYLHGRTRWSAIMMSGTLQI